ncbi:MAG: hypothetical protein Q9225_001057 [Loekoesia sp. 1 TL-2023]
MSAAPTLEQDNTSPLPVLKAFLDSRVTGINPYGSSSVEGPLRKRSGVSFGPGLRLNPFKITMYVGGNQVLQSLYRGAIQAALSHPPGSTTPFLRVTYGLAMMEFNSDQPIKWADIMYFAARMLGRVKNGEQNFYVADLVTAPRKQYAL